mmetsp:Transcript_9133/g.25488  ORF Transcript_9133/g.25488 Transcript_9133/m.25488 type:complete len:277 (-) Transcript_9133:165-995(-)
MLSCGRKTPMKHSQSAKILSISTSRILQDPQGIVLSTWTWVEAICHRAQLQITKFFQYGLYMHCILRALLLQCYLHRLKKFNQLNAVLQQHLLDVYRFLRVDDENFEHLESLQTQSLGSVPQEIHVDLEVLELRHILKHHLVICPVQEHRAEQRQDHSLHGVVCRFEDTVQKRKEFATMQRQPDGRLSFRAHENVLYRGKDIIRQHSVPVLNCIQESDYSALLEERLHHFDSLRTRLQHHTFVERNVLVRQVHTQEIEELWMLTNVRRGSLPNLFR